MNTESNTPEPKPVYVVQTEGNGLATAGLVCGIVGVSIGALVWILYVVTFALGTLAVVFGAVGRRRYNANPTRGGKGKSTAAIVLGIVALVFGVAAVVTIAQAVEAWETAAAVLPA